MCALVKPENPDNQEIFMGMWREFSYLWDYQYGLMTAIQMTILLRRGDLLEFILLSHTTLSIFASFSVKFKLYFIEKLFLLNFGSLNDVTDPEMA
jgi:hypothetical protein